MNPPHADVTQFMLGFGAGEAAFFAAYAAGKFRTRKIARETRRSRNLRAVERFMFECDVLLWGVCAVAIDGPSAACNHVTTRTETAHERTC